MAHESFEHAGVADVLNQHYVSIKVDREERPDVDRVYMTYVQVTTGSGGWPMSVWLTPSLEPFYGGTYFPPTSRWGRPGFIEILGEVARVWREEPGKVLQSASSIIERLRSVGGRTGNPVVPGTGVLEAGVQEFAAAFDRQRGGFGDAPKFPRPSELLFLLREHHRTGADGPRDMVLSTLRAMAGGGMRDHIGGGFHRYSVDGDWRVPHFEKMLYDQAQLVLAYVEAAQLTGDPFFGEVAVDTLEYVQRDLMHPEGGFYSAEDADSVPPELAAEPSPHKTEGAFYIWRDEEIGQAVGDAADAVRLRYGILPDGNAPFDPQNEFTHKNLLYTARSVEEIASITGRTTEETEAAVSRGRAALLAVRSARPRPQLDDKVLTAWNGLMIAAFARAGRVIEGRGDYLGVARRAAVFVRTNLWKPDEGMLLRRYRQGAAGVEAYAEDYAYLIFGLLELFQANGDTAWLDWALTLQRRLDSLFWDPVDGGWYSTTGEGRLGPATAQGRVRRRRTRGHFGCRAQSAHVVASHGRFRDGRPGRRHIRNVRGERLDARARGADDACGALDVLFRGAADRHRGRSGRGGHARAVRGRSAALHTDGRARAGHRGATGGAVAPAALDEQSASAGGTGDGLRVPRLCLPDANDIGG